MEDQRMDQFVPKVEKADELPPMSSGIYHDLQFETYECPVCGGTFKKTEQRDHELAHEYDRTYRRKVLIFLLLRVFEEDVRDVGAIARKVWKDEEQNTRT